MERALSTATQRRSAGFAAAQARPWDVRSVLGVLSVVAMLLLASPGVRVVRADDALRAEDGDAVGGVCDATAPEVPARQLEAAIENLRRQALAEALGPPGPPSPAEDRPIVLNGRGYNYGPRPSLEPTLLRLEDPAPRQP